MTRRGPRPLALHMALLTLRRGVAMANLPLALTPPPCLPGSMPWNTAWPRSKAGQAGVARIAAALGGGSHPPEAFAAAVWRALGRADAGLLAGVAAYRAHPWRRALADPPVIWAEGGSRLLDYGVAPGPVVFFVPSLINRAQVLDLLPGGSLLRFLAGRGLRPLLLDWGSRDRWSGASA